MASICCFTLFKHRMALPLAFALAKAGNSIPAKIAMMAMTTSSSIRVNALRRSVTWVDMASGVVFLEHRLAQPIQ